MEKPINREDIEKALNDLKDTLPSIKNTKWEEDGIKYSSWEIRTGKGPSLFTGDAGAEMFMKALKKEFEKLSNG